MGGTVLYYVVGLPHVRHAEMLRPHLVGWRMRLVYESSLPWFAARPPRLPGAEVVAVRNRPRALWEGGVKCLIVATAQPRPVPIRLLAQAWEREVPVVGIEETHQIALNGGRVHNYALPVDHLFVASEYEREGFMRAGVPAEQVEAAGWPFNDGQPVVTSERRAVARRHLEMAMSDRVAVLILSGLYESGEDKRSRAWQLSLAAEGLPSGYQLCVRPHPAERAGACLALAARHAPMARLLDANIPAAEVLDAADLIINRGASQVCLEAIMRDVPLMVFETGWPTVFPELLPEVVVRKSSDIPGVLDRLGRPGIRQALYQRVLSVHGTRAPVAARAEVARRLREIAAGERSTSGHAQERQWFLLALYAAWRGERAVARDVLRQVGRAGQWPVDALMRTAFGRAADGDLLILQRALGGGFDAAVLRALWIRQLARHRRVLDDQMRAWIGLFPPPVNTPWFARDTAEWAMVLRRHGDQQALRELKDRVEREYQWHPELRRIAEQLGVPGGLAFLRYRMLGRFAYQAH